MRKLLRKWNKDAHKKGRCLKKHQSNMVLEPENGFRQKPAHLMGNTGLSVKLGEEEKRMCTEKKEEETLISKLWYDWNTHSLCKNSLPVRVWLCVGVWFSFLFYFNTASFLKRCVRGIRGRFWRFLLALTYRANSLNPTKLGHLCGKTWRISLLEKHAECLELAQ